jgi:hypothetical protein
MTWTVLAFLFFTMAVVLGFRSPPPALLKRRAVSPSPASKIDAAMQAALSAILLVAGVFVILSKDYGTTDKHWAYGTVGTLVGFWLRPVRSEGQSTSSRRLGVTRRLPK